NAIMRYLTERLAEIADKEPCDGVKDVRVERTSLPDLPPAEDRDALPDRPLGTCYSNADNLYEQRLKELLQEAFDKRHGLYEQLKSWLLREDDVGKRWAAKNDELNAIKAPGGATLSPAEEAQKAALKREEEQIRLEVDEV